MGLKGEAAGAKEELQAGEGLCDGRGKGWGWLTDQSTHVGNKSSKLLLEIVIHAQMHATGAQLQPWDLPWIISTRHRSSRNA